MPSAALSCLLALLCGPLRGQTAPKFVDVTAQAGIGFRHSMGASKLTNILQSAGAGACFFDYDGDGFLDIYFVNGADLFSEKSSAKPTNRLYRNNQDGQFSDVTTHSGAGDEGYGHGCVAADYDNDGDQDVYVTNYGPNALYRNNGDGTFSDVAGPAGVANPRWSTGATFGDYDGDGRLDLYVTNYLDFEINRKVKRSRLSASEGYKFFPGPRDYDGQPDALYHNNGDGTFTDATKQAGVFNPAGKGMQTVFSDYDNDGDADMYVANDRTANFLYVNQGGGVFEERALAAGVALDENGNETGAMGVAVGDFDNDGWSDLLVTNMVFEYNSLYRNNTDGSFNDVTKRARIARQAYPYVGWGTDLFDYDNDGDLDLFVANGHVQDYIDLFSESVTFAQRNLLFSNNGDGTFRDVSNKSGAYFNSADVSRGAATGDYDNDGDADLLICNLNGPPVLLRNDGGNGNHWLMVELTGVHSNRDGVGAKIKLTAGDLTQTREVRTGAGYLSQNDKRALFGLGGGAKIDVLEVRWPSGKVDRHRDLDPGRGYVVVEGEGIRPAAVAGRR